MTFDPKLLSEDDIDEDVILAAIGEVSSDVITRLDAEGRILAWTPGAEQMLGFTRDEIIGHSVNIIIPAELQELERERIRKQIEGGVGTLKEKTTRIHKSGDIVPVLLTRVPLYNRQGECVSLLAILKDLSAEEQLQKQIEHLQRDTAMAKVAAKVAHEIRTPLGVLFLKSDLLVERLEGAFEEWGAGDAERHRKVLKKCVVDIQKQISRLEEIANNYLHLSKTRAMEKTDVNLRMFIRDTITELREHYAEENITLKFEMPEMLPIVKIDIQQFQRAFANLFRNSVEAMRGTQRKDGEVCLSVQCRNNQIEFVVRDNGPGMPEDIRKAAFDPFTTTKSIGTGLGLYLVREIVENHGGTIQIHAVDGKGTTIRIVIPFQEE
ncbi:MAG: PAS domain S-box protein [Candidatus Omnitrophota bacterium]|jgi:PAS domain S-box-containing protein|nr:MAG: PAS domain S-box protein [Candidatus Omnitrophota bacterium]